MKNLKYFNNLFQDSKFKTQRLFSVSLVLLFMFLNGLQLIAGKGAQLNIYNLTDVNVHLP